MVGTAFEIADVFLFKTYIFMIIRTHPEELRGLKVHVYENIVPDLIYFSEMSL